VALLARAEIDSLLKRALELPGEERERFLDETCDRGTDLRRAVDRMLARCEADDGLLKPGGGAAGPLWEALARDHAAALALEPGERLGAYRVVRMLGRGGMATVYLAERADGQFEQAVALKLLDSARDFASLAARFAQERQILARLEHPNIARLIDGGTTRAGQPYVVMEYVDGVPLDRYCDQHRLDVDARIRLFGDVAAAVQYAHGHLVVHRDIKPSNILVTADGQPKLLDFGIAKLLDPAVAAPVTRSVLHPMTPEFASPEQVRGEALTTASDVYQLGHLLYQLLAGRSPYDCDRGSVASLVDAICRVEPVRPSAAVTLASAAPATTADARSTTVERLRRRLTGDLDNIVLKALQKEPARRYQSALQLSDDLRRHLDGLPVTARKDTLAYRTRKFIGRHRAGMAAALLAVMSLTAGFGVALWQANEKAREAAKAEEVKNFVLSLFERADPEVAQGETMTVVTLLEQGSERVEQELMQQPATQADLYQVLGRVYHRLGANDRALAELERSLEIRKRLFGPADPAVADVTADLGDVRNSLGDYDVAIRLQREALKLREEQLGPADPGVVASRIALGKSLSDDGKFAESERMLREALAHSRDPSGAAGAMLAPALETLAEALRIQGKHDEAEAMLREAVSQRRIAHGAGHSEVARSLMMLAGLLRQKGDLAEAETMAREALEVLERVYGPEHPTVARALTTLAGVQHQQASFEDAARGYRRALDIQRKNFGDGSMRVAHAQLSLAATLQALGEFAEAEAAARAAHATFVQSVGARHMWSAVSLQVLGANLYELGRLREAESELARARDLTREIWNEEHPQFANVLFDYAKVLLARGRTQEAEAAFRRTVQLRRVQYGNSGLFVADPEAWLGRCHARAGRLNEAEGLMIGSYPVQLDGFASVGGSGLGEHRPVARLAAALRQQEVEEVVGGHRLAEQAPLAVVAVAAPEEIELLLRLDALGDHVEAEVLAHLDDRAHECRVLARDVRVAHEGLVDLERADRELLQRRERGIAGAEVVDREVQAHRAQLFEKPDHSAGLGHEGGLGDLELEVGRSDPGVVEHGAVAGEEFRLAELLERKVDRDAAGPRHLLLPGAVVAADALQHPLADLLDQVRFFRERDELRGRDVAVVREPPSHQRLAADHPPVAQVHLRLVEDHELVALHRAAELALHHQPLDRGRAHLAREEAVAVAAVLLGVVHRRVRVADQVDDVVGIPRAQRDADAAGDVQLVLVELERPPEFVEQLPGEGADHRPVVGRRREILHEQGKFVAGEPAQHGVPGELPVHALGQDLERTVAGRVAEGVVDLLEAVEVEVDQRELPLRPPRARDGLLQRVLELEPVRHLGQRVVAREVADAPLGALALGDVAGDEDAALEARVVGRHHRARERDRYRLAGLRAHRELEHLVRRLLDVECGTVLVGDQEGEVAAEQLHLRPAEHLRRGEVDALDQAVRRGHEHRVIHAVQHDVERPAGGGVVRQVDAQPLERGAERAADAALRHLDVRAPVAAREPLHGFQHVGEGGGEASLEAPGRDERNGQDEAQPQQRPVLAQERDHRFLGAPPRKPASYSA
jgi:serine/threonine-protein kinase